MLADVLCELHLFDQAFRTAQESVRLSKEIENDEHICFGLAILGMIEAWLDQFTLGRRHLSQAFQIAHTFQTANTEVGVLFFLAVALTREGEDRRLDEASRRQKKAEALSLFSRIYHHPTTFQIFKDRSYRFIGELEAALPQAIAAQAKSSRLDQGLSQIVLAMLEHELRSSG
jgi:hypothetical protein